MTPWTAVRAHVRGRRAPVRADAELLRAWAEGDRTRVERVTDAEGAELDPREVDWTGMEPPPARRPGRPRTGRGRDGGQILVRVTTEERERIQRAADAAGEPVAAWVRDAALRAAR